MAIKKCKECAGKVSTSAKQCPHCGAAAPKSDGLLSIVVVFIVVWIGVVSSDKKQSNTDNQPPIESKLVVSSENSKAVEPKAIEPIFDIARAPTKEEIVENQPAADSEKHYSDDEILKMEDEKQYHGDDSIVRARLGLPPKNEKK